MSLLLAGLSILIFHQITFAESRFDNQNEPAGILSETSSLRISSSPEILALTQDLIKDFALQHPAMKFEKIGVLEETASSLGNLTLISNEDSPVLANSTNWRIAVAREVIVPIINQGNPMYQQLQKRGISAAEFSRMLEDPSKKLWSALLENGAPNQVRLYMSSQASILGAVEKFAQRKLKEEDYQVFESPAAVIEAVKSDQFAIGFCRLSDLQTPNTSAVPVAVAILPIDKNGNGRLDNFEDIFANLEEFVHGVWVGKYPKSLTLNVYAVAPVKPEAAHELAFLTWLVAGGQQYMNPNGFCELTSMEKQSSLASLKGIEANDKALVDVAEAPQSWPIVLTITAFIGLFIAVFFYSRRRVESTQPNQQIEIAPRLIEQLVNVPNGLYFDKTHTWAFMEQDGNVRIGIDDFLQHITGKLTKIKMKETGEKVRKGETIMSIIQDGKQLNLYAPISGKIVAQNELLNRDSSLLNSSPFFKGWVYQIEPTNWLREAQFMLMGETYREWLRDEFTRLKDFITNSVKTNEMAYSHVVLQDGGELSDNVLASLEPKVWEDFQTQFIDTSR